MLDREYAITATLTALPGEYDLNFTVQQSGKPSSVLKVMRVGCDPSLVEMQCAALEHIHQQDSSIPVPQIIKSVDDRLFVAALDPDGKNRLLWLITVLPGELYGNVMPHPLPLVRQIGETLARLDRALAGFQHPGMARDLKWDLRSSDWIGSHLELIDGLERRQFIQAITKSFVNELKARLARLPCTAIHNDLNDYNILVNCGTPLDLKLSGIIDFGDLISAPIVCDIAIAAAYAVLGQNQPIATLATLVAGYNSVHSLSDDELQLIYPLVLTRLAVSVTNSAIMKRERPHDPYVTISEQPAWDFLDKAARYAPDWVEASLQVACVRSCRNSNDILSWINAHRGQFAPVLNRPLRGAQVVDLSATGSAIPRDPLQFEINDLTKTVSDTVEAGNIGIGRYAEPRLIYTSAEFRTGKHPASPRRTVHLGVDLFCPAGTAIHAPWDGIIHAVGVRSAALDYGGVVVIEHKTPSRETFYTLYGHLAHAGVQRLIPGQRISFGEIIAYLGTPAENGGWTPHLHFQLGLSTLGRGADWPGVCDPDEVDAWTALFPNPAALLNLDEGKVAGTPVSTATLLTQRHEKFSHNLRLSYRAPLNLVRGWRHYLFDQDGRCYLDAYNNVPHVGHCHPRLTAVAERQMRRLNTNTRYLSSTQIEYADTLTAKLPKSLEVCFFVNSGSEANELALRLARAHTGRIDTIVLKSGYHGNTNAAIDISEYKFNGPGGRGAPVWVHVVPIADPYRGPYKHDDPDSGLKYSKFIVNTIDQIQHKDRKLAAFIGETFPSVGGQIIPPNGYLQATYAAVRAAGGVCIADEVQTGLGRIGSHYWAFETQAVVPDIVVLGKPIGNGHPLSAVITTREIAASFDNGMEFFSTFGGSTLSCAIGLEVLHIIEDENLQQNAFAIGNHLLAGLKSLQHQHRIIGEVRGLGLFLGVELVADQATLEPATQVAKYIVNRLREKQILIGTDGPFDNVLKIRPPLTFTQADASHLVDCLGEILREEPCKSTESSN